MLDLERQSPPSAALLTPVGRGAVATIRVCGDVRSLDKSTGPARSLDCLDCHSSPLFRAANGLPLYDQVLGRIVFGRWRHGEEIVVCRLQREVLEIHCHGGDAAARRILDDLEQSGVTTIDWRKQLKESMSLLDTECAEALSRASTWRAAEILSEQSAGLLFRALQSLYDNIKHSGNLAAVLAELKSLLAWSPFGIHLSQPWMVVLTGRPNVGKSSLINALLGYQRAIVFDQPGTTRDVLTAETAFDGWPVTLADTAGLRTATDELEIAGMELAKSQLDRADARLVLVDLNQPPEPEDLDLIDRWPGAIVIGHKSDLDDLWNDRLPSTAVRASSVTGQGLEEIQQRLIQRLVPLVPPAGTPVPVHHRQERLLKSARDHLLGGDPAAAGTAIQCVLYGD